MRIQKMPLKISNQYSDSYLCVRIENTDRTIRVTVLESPFENEVYKLYDKDKNILSNTIIVRFEDFFSILYDIINKHGVDIEKIKSMELDNEMIKLLSTFNDNKNERFRGTRKQAFIDMNFICIMNDEVLLNEFINYYLIGIIISNRKLKSNKFRI